MPQFNRNLTLSALFFMITFHAFTQHNSEPFRPILGVCTSVKNFQIAAVAGFDYIEESVQRFLCPLEPDSIFRKNLEILKTSTLPVLACNGFIPGKLKSTGPETDHEAILAYADTAFRRANEAGIKIIVFGSSGSRNFPDGFDPAEALDQFSALLEKMGPLAGKYDIIVVIEPLQQSESNLVNLVGQATAIAQSINHPNIRVLGDIFHMMRENEPAEALSEANTLLRHMHIAELVKRTPPGFAGDNFTPYLNALKMINYPGAISIECGWGDDFATELIKARAFLYGQIVSLDQ